jgi:hypothetical protein
MTDLLERRMRCPYCNAVYEPDFCDGDGGMVTLWGEGEPVERECHDCEKTFYVLETVTRYFKTAKTEEEAWGN